jgi:hypothetical protein
MKLPKLFENWLSDLREAALELEVDGLVLSDDDPYLVDSGEFVGNWAKFCPLSDVERLVEFHRKLFPST